MSRVYQATADAAAGRQALEEALAILTVLNDGRLSADQVGWIAWVEAELEKYGG